MRRFALHQIPSFRSNYLTTSRVPSPSSRFWRINFLFDLPSTVAGIRFREREHNFRVLCTTSPASAEGKTKGSSANTTSPVFHRLLKV